MGDSFDKIKEGVKKTGEGIKEGVEETAEDVKEGVEETGEEIKEGAEEATDSDTYVSSEGEGEVLESEGDEKAPMNPEDIAEHEPTAVKRDKNQSTSGDPV
jgi:hypothetical protein